MKTFIYSRSRGRNRREARAYFAERMTRPDEGSAFEKQMGCIMPVLKVPGVATGLTRLIEPIMMRRGYDALVLRDDECIVGHTAYQVHADNTLHVFACELHLGVRGRGFGFAMNADVIDEARKRGIARVRIGGGNHPATNRIHEKMRDEESFERIEVLSDNWVRIIYSAPSRI